MEAIAMAKTKSKSTKQKKDYTIMDLSLIHI